MKIIILFLFSMITLSLFSDFQCGRDFPECQGENNISNLAIQIAPNLKTYAVGDTIWLSVDFDTNLELTSGSNSIDIDSANGYVEMRLMKLTKGEMKVDTGYSDFEIVNQRGSLVRVQDNGLFKGYYGLIQYNCSSDSCSFKVGLIPKEKGIYCLSLSNGATYANPNSNQLDCNLLNRFSENVFVVNDYNKDILKNIGLNNKQLTIRDRDGFLHFIDVFFNNGAYVLEVN